jgi:hypothetical protein
MLHVTNGDAVVPEIAAAADVAEADVLPWRDVLHDGPVPGGLGPAELAAVRAAFLAERYGRSERSILADLLGRDARLDELDPHDEVVLWFEDDLYDVLQLAQIEDRLVGRPGPVGRVHLAHPPRGDLRVALAARERCVPDAGPFAALRSPDPRAWLEVPGFARLVEELPDARSGLGRLEREVLEALTPGPLAPSQLFAAVSAREQPPWLADASLWAIADRLAPLVLRDRGGRYRLGEEGRRVLAGEARRPPDDRWLGGVRLAPGNREWAWDPGRREIVESGSD